ncbi:MAG: hypothetical protein DRZ76_04055 [Candidatus Nealsonbacteria bacterium]|nr:MAG: hypothetical protein DRZ76_04055 [Candidatus Nealsonbacteria bacterium]
MKGFLKRWLGKSPPEETVVSTEKQPLESANLPTEIQQANAVLYGQPQGPVQQQAETDTSEFSSLVQDLRSPEARKEFLIAAYISTLFIPAVLFALGLQPIAVLSFAFLVFIWGIRYVPPVHCALLYDIRGRTKIGFHEGPIWIPWFLWARVKLFSIDRFTKQMSEDTWTTDRIHVIHKSRIYFSISPVAHKSFWVNFFWWWHAQTESQAYEEFEDENFDLGEGLHNFIMNRSIDTARDMAISRIMEIIREMINGERFDDIFTFQDGQWVGDKDKMELISKRIKSALKDDEEIRQIGIHIVQYALRDIEPHPEMAKALEHMTRAPWIATGDLKAHQQYFTGMKQVGQELVEDPAVGQATLEVSRIKVADKAADSGLIDVDLVTRIMSKMKGFAQLVGRKIISPKGGE